ncbi:hypothetical protein GN244_ATG06165 [Phytophthora infestans]|uniref:Uncharacterized protein n=1 Tax=Phytophthora infestans TaxID=4787 RepID=A0A833T121_PHYIN|nr:hypothetical protein GN244_ATG06165 [Phytophthora infestans]
MPHLEGPNIIGESSENRSSPGECHVNDIPRAIVPAETALFKALLRETDVSYFSVDDVIRSSGINELPGGVINSVHRRTTDGEIHFYQQLDKFTLPFKFNQTEKAV